MRPEQLAADLKRGLRPVYLVSGDETLLVQEACDAIRAAARDAGFSDRQVMHVEAGFNWSEVLAASQEMSLFAERKLLDLRLPSGKPGDEGSKTLVAYCESTNEDTLLLITAPKLDGSAKRAKWYKALESTGTVIICWPISPEQLPQWLQQRFQRAGFNADPEAIQLLAERVQGNLLAAAQEVEKLALYAEDGRIDLNTVAATVGDSARFDVFALVDTALSGDAASALRTLRGLRAEGTEPPIVLWALARELRLLYGCAVPLAEGAGIDRLLDGARVFDRRKPLLKAALKRLSPNRLAGMIRRAAAADRAVKGVGDNDPWILMEDILLGLAGGGRRQTG